MEKTRPIIDFKELAAFPTGHGLEALARQLGHTMGLIPDWTGVGPDDGKDLFFYEIQQGKLSSDRIIWLVQCKDKSESGDCVTDLDRVPVTDKLVQHKCQGFLLITTTCVGANLKKTLDGIKECGSYKTLVWDQFELTKLLLEDRHRPTFKQYFPKSYQQNADFQKGRMAGSASESGAFLGRKSWYKYTTNEGNDYKYQTFDYLGEAAGLERNDSFEAVPRNITPRYVMLSSVKPAMDGQYKQKKMVIQPETFQNGGMVSIAGMEMAIIAYMARG